MSKRSELDARLKGKLFHSRRRETMVFALTLFVFTILSFTAMLIGAIVVALAHLDIIHIYDGSNGLIFGAAVLLIFSVVVGTSLFAIFGRHPLKPVRRLKWAVREIIQGNYAVRVEKSYIPELDALITDFNTMAGELGSVEALRNDFIDNFSHEFRTPIVSIRGFAKLLKSDQLTPEERTEYLNIIIEESDRLVQLSSNVLSLSKLENQAILPERKLFSLDEQLRRVIVFLEPTWKKKQIAVDVDLIPVRLNCNEELLKQAWLNLISNAIKFTPQGGNITVCLQAPATIKITDTGIGMDEATQMRIFDKFYQGDPSHAMQGHGLGLALVRRILDMCSGEIEVTSQLGVGTTFIVKLPIDPMPN
ncbi:MAG: HAMP domain-containing sensor histidine kinase [Eubacteriales bacterium]|nr:HAMP domain-containing sensor histidine kinase [Eubacteriales bacterium]